MDTDQMKTELKKSKYFQDSEGKFRIVSVGDRSFKVRDADGDEYELFYSDYRHQPFSIIS